MSKDKIILGTGEYAIVPTGNKEDGLNAITIMKHDRYSDSEKKPIGGRVEATDIKEVDDEKDTVIYFNNIQGLQVLINQLEIIELDMRIKILSEKSDINHFKG